MSVLRHDSDGTAFDPHKINLSRFAGKKIKIRFFFDTLDSANNNHEGWYIDLDFPDGLKQ